VTESIAISKLTIPANQIVQYHDEGYMILPRVISEDSLQMLREECSYFLGYMDAEMDAKGVEEVGINHGRNRYFISNRYHLSPRMWHFIYSDLMAEIAKAALGPDAYLFNEQWVVKAAEKGRSFRWHQDSGYVKFGDKQTNHRPYLSCWCPLDDVNEMNGSIYLLPHSRGGTKNWISDHTRDEESNDLVGYRGDDPGIPVEVPAGSIVAFTSYSFHRSGSNTTPNMRRVFLSQYSAEPILGDNGSLWSQAVPFVKDGANIYDHAADMAART
jgi:ectoine hydroxylase-related dioxygenase (phytanoyl-CoA dioxygenase family)